MPFERDEFVSGKHHSLYTLHCRETCTHTSTQLTTFALPDQSRKWTLSRVARTGMSVRRFFGWKSLEEDLASAPERIDDADNADSAQDPDPSDGIITTTHNDSDTNTLVDWDTAHDVTCRQQHSLMATPTQVVLAFPHGVTPPPSAEDCLWKPRHRRTLQHDVVSRYRLRYPSLSTPDASDPDSTTTSSSSATTLGRAVRYLYTSLTHTLGATPTSADPVWLRYNPNDDFLSGSEQSFPSKGLEEDVHDNNHEAPLLHRTLAVECLHVFVNALAHDSDSITVKVVQRYGHDRQAWPGYLSTRLAPSHLWCAQLPDDQTDFLLDCLELMGFVQIRHRESQPDLVILHGSVNRSHGNGNNKKSDNNNNIDAVAVAVARFDVQQAQARVQVQIQSWTAQADACTVRARQAQRNGRKSQALWEMKRRHLFTQQIERQYGILLNLETAQHAIESASHQTAVVAALSQASHTLRLLRTTVSMGDVDRVADELFEELEEMRIRDDALVDSTATDTMDDDELLEELAALTLQDAVPGESNTPLVPAVRDASSIENQANRKVNKEPTTKAGITETLASC